MAVGTIWVGLNWRKDAAPFLKGTSIFPVFGKYLSPICLVILFGNTSFAVI